MRIIGVRYFENIIYVDSTIEGINGNLYMKLPRTPEMIEFVKKIMTLEEGRGYLIAEVQKGFTKYIIRELRDGQLTRDGINTEAPRNMNPIVAESWKSFDNYVPDFSDTEIYYYDFYGWEDPIPGAKWEELGLRGKEDIYKSLPVYAVDDQGNYWAIPPRLANELFKELVDAMEPVEYDGPAELWISKDNKIDWVVYEKYSRIEYTPIPAEHYRGRVDFKNLNREFYGPRMVRADENIGIFQKRKDWIAIGLDVSGATRYVAETFMGVTEFSDYIRDFFDVEKTPSVKRNGIILYYSPYKDYRRIIKNFRIVFAPQRHKFGVQKIAEGPDNYTVKTGRFHRITISENGIKEEFCIFC